MVKKKRNDSEIGILSIGDIHFGAADDNSLYNELKKEFIGLAEEEKENIDLIVIDGDYFDRILKMSENSARLAMKFFNELFLFCEGNQIQLRLMRGTLTHDVTQLELFKIYDYPGSIFKYYDKVTVEEVFEGFKCLFLPEEYPTILADYYADTVFVEEDTYDMVFVHGTFDFQAWQTQVIESEKHVPSAPVWDAKHFMSISKGPICCGHIHVPISYKDRIFYHGSFSRLNFGEEQEKGFNLAVYDTANPTDPEKTYVEFCPNLSAPLYKTIDADILLTENNENVEEFLLKLDEITEDADTKFRFIFSDDLNKRDIIKLTVEKFSSTKNATIKIINKIKFNTVVTGDTLSTEGAEPVVQTLDETEYGFLVGGHVDLPNTIAMFCKKKYDADLSIENIQDAIKAEIEENNESKKTTKRPAKKITQ